MGQATRAAGGLAPNHPNSENAVRVTQDDRVASVKFLLDLGLDIEAQNKQGYRAMHMAAASGFNDVIKFLVGKGAELNPMSKGSDDSYGPGMRIRISAKTPLGIADGFFGGALFIHPDTAAYLRTLGAKSVGADTLETYKEQFKEEQTKPAAK